MARTKKQQWDALLAVLHSPEFHVKERLLQNERVARTFERKNQYKATNSALKEQLTAQKAVWDRQLDTTSCKLEEVQQISNISLQTINSMQQEVSELNKKMHEAQAKIDLERKSVQCKDIAINDLNQQLVSANENALGTSTELCESKARVESIESQLEEKDIQINKMQQDLIKAEYSNASLSEQLASVSKIKEEKDIQINKMQQDLIKAEYSNASLSEQLASVSKIKEEKDIQINKMQQDLIKAESKLASSKSTVALLCKSAEEKESDAQRESALACISVRSQEIHEVLLQVKEQNQVDVDEILKTIRSELRRALDSQIIPTKSSLTSDKETDESNNEPDAEHFVQNVLSEAFATTFCT